MKHRPNTQGATRRKFLIGGAAMLAAPYVLKGKALAAGQVIVRTPGGVYDDIMRRHVYDPFTEETGITVMPVAATVANLLAMFQANNVELDLIDTGDGPLIRLARMGALAPIDYDSWSWSNPDDVDAAYRTDTHVANFTYSSVLAYNTDSFSDEEQPDSWADFWDAETFPGPRMLADMASGTPNLEFALLADGVSPEDIYPIDLDRAFESMSRIKPHIRRFWDTGAISAQLLSDREVLMGSIWNGRLQTIIDEGAPLAFTWNEHMLQVQALSIFKDSPNVENAQKLIDFMMQPNVQAGYAADLRYGPTNSRAFEQVSADLIDEMPGNPNIRHLGFIQNVEWWEDNRDLVNRTWSRWVLQ